MVALTVTVLKLRMIVVLVVAWKIAMILLRLEMSGPHLLQALSSIFCLYLTTLMFVLHEYSDLELH